MPITFRVRELREAKGWTAAHLAEVAGIRPATLSAIETGQTAAVYLDVLDRLAAALEVDPGFLLRRVDEPKKRGKRP